MTAPLRFHGQTLELVTLLVERHGQDHKVAISWDLLRDLADKNNPRNAPTTLAAYGPVYAEAVAARNSEAVARFGACPGHKAARERLAGFVGPVAREENRSAHGGRCLIETCTCGGERHSNINGQHRETGAWTPKEISL